MSTTPTAPEKNRSNRIPHSCGSIPDEDSEEMIRAMDAACERMRERFPHAWGSMSDEDAEEMIRLIEEAFEGNDEDRAWFDEDRQGLDEDRDTIDLGSAPGRGAGFQPGG